MFVRYIGPYRPFVDQIYGTGLWQDLRQVRPVPNEAGRAMVANHPDVYEAVGPVPPEGVPDFANVWQQHVDWEPTAVSNGASHVFMVLPPGIIVVDVTLLVRTPSTDTPTPTMAIGHWDTETAAGATGDASYWLNNRPLNTAAFSRQRYTSGRRQKPFRIEGAQGKYLVGTISGASISPIAVTVGVEAVLY